MRCNHSKNNLCWLTPSRFAIKDFNSIQGCAVLVQLRWERKINCVQDVLSLQPQYIQLYFSMLLRSLVTLIFLVFSFTTFGQYSNGLVGEFLFNGHTNDSSPTQVNGTPYNQGYSSGQDGISNGAVELNGTNAYVDAGSAYRSMSDQVTVACYVKTTSTSFTPILFKYNPSSDAGIQLLMGNETNDPTLVGTVRFSGRAGVNQYLNSGNSTTAINDGQWHCIIGVMTPTTWSIYVDGVLENQNSYSISNPDITVNAPLLIGKNHAINPVKYFDGEIDDVRIWNRSFTASEAQNYCGCTIPISFPNPSYTFCGNSSQTISTSTSADSIYWVNTNTSGSTTSISYPDSGWFEVQAFNSGSCTGIDSVHVSWTPLPVSDLIVETGQTLCEQTGTYTIDASAANADSYTWSDGVNGAQRTISYPNGGWFYLTATYGSCSLTDSILITWIDEPQIDLGPDLVVCPDETTVLSASVSGGTPLWFDGRTTTSTTVTGPGTYYASVTNQCGTATDTIVVTLATSGCGSQPQDTLPAIHLPTAFTPNGDGLNDGFGVQTEMAFGYFKMTIQDRIGNRVFEGYSKDAHWNGTYQNNGEPVPLGTYIYRIEYITLNQGKSGSLYGYVTVLY